MRFPKSNAVDVYSIVREIQRFSRNYPGGTEVRRSRALLVYSAPLAVWGASVGVAKGSAVGWRTADSLPQLPMSHYEWRIIAGVFMNQIDSPPSSAPHLFS